MSSARVGVALALTFVAGTAHGEPVATLEVSAPLECPSFREALAARVPDLASAAGGRAITVRITKTPKWSARIALDDDAPRTITGSSCAEVVDAAAVVAALALDGSDSPPPEPSEPVTPATPNAPAIPPPAQPEKVVCPDPAPRPPPVAEAAPASAAPVRDTGPSLGDQLRDWHAVTSLEVRSVYAGSGDHVAPLAQIGVMWDGLFVARLGWSRGATSIAVDNASADLRWYQAHLSMCALLPRIPAIAVGACGLFVGGTVSSTTTRTTDGVTSSGSSRASLATGASLRGEILLENVVSVGAEVGILAQLTRPTFDAAGTHAYTTPAAMPFVGLFIGVRWN